MHAKLIAVPLISGALLTGCAGTYTPSEIAGLQAPEPGASRARALMLQFGYSVPDMTEKGVCAQAEDPRDEGHPYGADETQRGLWGLPSFSGLVEASLSRGDQLSMPHFFGFIPKESAADEKRAVRVAAAEAVRALTEAGAAEGWASAAGKPRPLEMSLSYTVRQTVYFAKEGTRCKLPADPASPTSEEASGCRAEVLVRSRDITKGEHPGESGFEPVPAWIDPAQPEAWRVRTVTISSFDGTGQVLLDAAAQEKIAARAKGLLYFYGIDAKDRPFVGENGRILHFVKAAGGAQ
ncbi:MAG: hypothetical protein ACFWTZ_09485 [Burkholderia sp.]|jgi:uncharacterized protein (DUF779 family)